MTDETCGDDDVPWASPEIRLRYEAALGRFILSFNELDNRLTEIIETTLKRIGRNDLVKSCTNQNFALKLLVLDLLKSSSEGAAIANVPVTLMKQIAGERNTLAHGHFDQNPFDGSYDIVAKNVRAFYSVERLEELTANADKALEALRYASAVYDFGDPPT
ncbi:hypothetical protein [Bradyrhizobium sp. Leo121]|uniref:hypothetical protein n=1 Tax=Bradyrhizobium sp. Leo121 TaxID=1571195 RepID=UPI0010298C4A|nr:hypothetical protein [Bradyrhizobium sp. Leo121]RZN20037.1 hypothetical protein CWO90_34700 [Bradyrhizobium sp. Leo121]